MKTKTHEVCEHCHQWIALDKPHIVARKKDDKLVYLHLNPCFHKYSYSHALSYIVVFGTSDAVYGGGS